MQTVFPHYNETLKKWDVCYQRFDSFDDAQAYAESYEEDGFDGYYNHVEAKENAMH